MSRPIPEKRAGVATDAQGGPVVDPTSNVLDLVEAGSKRQDDLRESNNLWLMSEIKTLGVMAQLRDEHVKQLRELESKRLDAIRQVDQNNVNIAADRALQAIQALAATTSANAETLRGMVTATATTIATQTAQTFSAIVERIANLEKSSYQGQGKSTVADPMMEQLVREMQSLRDSRSQVTGKNQGINLVWVAIGGAISMIAGFLTIAGVLYAALKG